MSRFERLNTSMPPEALEETPNPYITAVNEVERLRETHRYAGPYIPGVDPEKVIAERGPIDRGALPVQLGPDISGDGTTILSDAVGLWIPKTEEE